MVTSATKKYSKSLKRWKSSLCYFFFKHCYDLFPHFSIKIVLVNRMSQFLKYPLVNIQKTLKNHRFWWTDQLFWWPCSIAVLVITGGQNPAKRYAKLSFGIGKSTGNDPRSIAINHIHQCLHTSIGSAWKWLKILSAFEELSRKNYPPLIKRDNWKSFPNGSIGKITYK